ncbi:MAG TPA: hypothetical protein VML95_02220 [Longimicrobiales bacterium]|nr:hypothetical protein [Longimicrobiales bacterium]
MRLSGVPGVLRTFGLVCLLGLTALGADPFRGGPADGLADVVRGPADGDGPAGWAGALASAAAPRIAVRTRASAPEAPELDALAALADRVPLAVELPAGGTPGLALRPAGPMAAGRRAALALTVGGAPGTTAAVTIEDEAGATDSVAIPIDSSGFGAATVGVRPASAGWRTWTVRAGGREARGGGWVEDAGPVRAAALGGAGGWETRYVARALEEAGADLRVRLALGRGRSVDSPGSGWLAAADVIVILPGAELSAAEVDAVAARVREDGAGVLIAGTGQPALAAALGLPVRAERAPPGAIAWSLPADLEPLPPFSGRDAPLSAEPPAGSAVGARAGPGAVLLLRPAGRGRAAWTGLADTWRWRLEGGSPDAHRAYWAALADWLAAGRLAGAEHAFEPSPPRVGELARARAPAGSAALLRAPSGALEPAGPFVPTDEGEHALVDERGRVLVGTRATPATVAYGFGRAALLAYGSGGAALPRAELTAWLAARDAESSPARAAAAWLLLVLATASFLLAWTIRRYCGAP